MLLLATQLPKKKKKMEKKPEKTKAKYALLILI
jgi:hypothetical protein